MLAHMLQQFSNNTLPQRHIGFPGPVAFLSTGAWCDVNDRTGQAQTQRYLLTCSCSRLPSTDVTEYPLMLAMLI